MSSLPGYSKLENAEALESTANQLVQIALEALRSGKKKVKLEVEVEAKLDDDGKTVKLEIEMEGEEDGKKESRELQYKLAL